MDKRIDPYRPGVNTAFVRVVLNRFPTCGEARGLRDCLEAWAKRYEEDESVRQLGFLFYLNGTAPIFETYFTYRHADESVFEAYLRDAEKQIRRYDGMKLVEMRVYNNFI